MAGTTTKWVRRVAGAFPFIGDSNPNPPELSQPFDGNYGPIIDYLSTLIQREVSSGNLTGVSIALVDNQQMIWSEGFGVANKALNAKANNKTRYRLASVSKLFNAVAIMREVERGTLDLDAPVADYVPDFTINSRFGSTHNITLRNLLTHHSGLPEDHLDGKWSRVRHPIESILDILSKDHIAYAANKISTYSNTGVTLSGLALQRQVSQPYEDYINEILLKPLQMTDSDFSGMLEGSDAAVGYKNGEAVEQLATRNLPSGGLISTVDDMANFAIAMLDKGRFNGKQLLNSDSFDEMLRIQNSHVLLDLSERIGLGWFYNVEKLGGLYDVVGHTGSSRSHTSVFYLVPELGFGAIVVCNDEDDSSAKGRIVGAALDQLFLTRGIKAASPSVSAPQTFDTGKILPGDYFGTGGLIRFVLKNDKLRTVPFRGKNSLVLEPKSANWYLPTLRPHIGLLPLPFTLDEGVKITRSVIDGRDLLITIDQGQLDVIGERIEPQPESAIWNKRLGSYQSCSVDEAETIHISKVSLRRGDGYYLVDLFHQSKLISVKAVQPVSDTELVVLGVGRGHGNTIVYSETSGKSVLSAVGTCFERITASPEKYREVSK